MPVPFALLLDRPIGDTNFLYPLWWHFDIVNRRNIKPNNDTKTISSLPSVEPLSPQCWTTLFPVLKHQRDIYIKHQRDIDKSRSNCSLNPLSRAKQSHTLKPDTTNPLSQSKASSFQDNPILPNLQNCNSNRVSINNSSPSKVKRHIISKAIPAVLRVFLSYSSSNFNRHLNYRQSLCMKDIDTLITSEPTSSNFLWKDCDRCLSPKNHSSLTGQAHLISDAFSSNKRKRWKKTWGQANISLPILHPLKRLSGAFQTPDQ